MDRKKIQELLIVVVAFFALMLISGYAAAAELNSAGPIQAVPGGSKGTVFFTGSNPNGCPNAVLAYSSDGAEFRLARGMGSSTLETLSMPIPDGSSMIIPVACYKAASSPSDTFKVKVCIDATNVAVTDSVFVLPYRR